MAKEMIGCALAACALAAGAGVARLGASLSLGIS